MKLRSPIVFVLAVFVALLSFTEAFGCSCLRPKPCQYAAQSDAVFVGEVLSSAESTRKANYGDREYEEMVQTSTVLVKEVFAGVGDAKEIKIVTDISSSCAFRLSEGVTYIFYSNGPGSDGNLGTGYCSGTKPVDTASDEIEDLRRDLGQRTTVSGTVAIEGYTGLAGTPPYKQGVRTVRLVGENGIAETDIDEQGRYKFTGIAAGEYSFEIPLPDLLRSTDRYNRRSPPGTKDPVRIKVSGIGCLVKFISFLQNGKISGTVTDSEGRPVGGVTVYLTPIGPDGKALDGYSECYEHGHCQRSEENGNFYFDGLEAGKYLVGVRLSKRLCNDCIDAKYLMAYYPGVTAAGEAKKVSVTLGKPVENVNFNLSRSYVEREIVGTVSFPDGRPVPHATIRYVFRSPDFKENLLSFVKTDETGRFSIKGYEGYRYLIGAYMEERDGNRTAAAIEVSVLPREAVKAVKLNLSSDAPNDYAEWDVFPKRPVKKRN